jgi:hypothetical protein
MARTKKVIEIVRVPDAGASEDLVHAETSAQEV